MIRVRVAGPRGWMFQEYEVLPAPIRAQIEFGRAFIVQEGEQAPVSVVRETATETLNLPKQAWKRTLELRKRATDRLNKALKQADRGLKYARGEAARCQGAIK